MLVIMSNPLYTKAFRGLALDADGARQLVEQAKEHMSSAKLQVRPILLKKIFFMIFFNNQLTTYGRIHCC